MKDQQKDLEQSEFQAQIANQCFENGIHYWTNAEYDLSITQLQRALEIRQDLFGRLNDDTAQSYLWLGTLYWHKEQFELALDCFSRSFRIKLELVNGMEFRNGIVSNWINKCLGSLNVEDKEAHWTLLKESIRHERHGDQLRRDGFWESATDEYRTALMLENRRRGIKDKKTARPLADTADLHVKIGKLFGKQKQYEKSLLELREAYSMFVSMFGVRQRYTIDVAEAIAETVTEMGYSQEVGEMYAENLYQALLQENSGNMFMEVKDFESALTCFRQALELESVGIGKLHSPCGTLNFKIARMYAKLHRYDDALLFYSKAFAIFESVLGPHHKFTVNSRKALRAVARMDMDAPKETGAESHVYVLKN